MSVRVCVAIRHRPRRFVSILLPSPRRYAFCGIVPISTRASCAIWIEYQSLFAGAPFNRRSTICRIIIGRVTVVALLRWSGRHDPAERELLIWLRFPAAVICYDGHGRENMRRLGCPVKYDGWRSLQFLEDQVVSTQAGILETHYAD